MKQSFKMQLVEDADKWGCKITSLSDFIEHQKNYNSFKTAFYLLAVLALVLILMVGTL